MLKMNRNELKKREIKSIFGEVFKIPCRGSKIDDESQNAFSGPLRHVFGFFQSVFFLQNLSPFVPAMGHPSTKVPKVI